MAVAFVAGNTGGDGASSNLVMGRPAGSTGGHIIVLDLYLEQTNQTISFSNGTWTLISSAVSTGTAASSFSHHRYWERVVSGTTGNVTLTWTDGLGHWRTCITSAYSGVSTATDPLDGVPATSTSDGSSVQVVLPSITLANNDSMRHACQANFDGRTSVYAVGWSTRTTIGNVGTADWLMTSSGATGASSATLVLGSVNTGGHAALKSTVTGGAPAVVVHHYRGLLGVGR